LKELRALVPYLARYRVPIAVGLGMVLVSNALNVGSLEFIRMGVDVLEQPDATAALVGRFALLSLLLALVGGVARFVMRQTLNSVSRRVETDLRDDLFAHLLRLDAGFYGAHSTGELMSRATNDVQAVRMAAGPAYMYLLNTIVFMLLATGRMLLIDPVMTAVALTPMLLLPPVTVGFGNIIHSRFEKIQAQFGVLSTMAQENLAGMRIVKAYGQETSQAERFSDLLREYMDRNVALAKTSGAFLPTLGLLAGIAMALAIWTGGRGVMAGTMTVGELVLFLLYLGMLAWPMIALGWVVNLFQRGAASMGRVSAILRTPPAVADAPDAAAPADVRGAVEFRDVTFRYPGTDRDVLHGVSFRIPPGAAVAVVGPTGAGKSTMVALLTRLYDPTGGEVLLDGVPLRQWPLEALRRAVAVVPQDTFLFSTTIADNLALGLEHAQTPEEDAAVRGRVRDAAEVAQLHGTIDDFPGGYDTLLGERGINLSGGQKQRAALARAVARDAPVLVLDDSLSAVDTHTEHRILQRLRGVFAGRTSLVVSHRVTAVMDADLILVMDGGRVVETGRHAELLRRGGVYAALQRRQLLAEDLADDDALAAPRHGV
jgi:ATP-binding cassette, subfamily B, multidrug efflux pump